MAVIGNELRGTSAKDVAYAICNSMGLSTDGVMSVVINAEANQAPSITIKRKIDKKAAEGIEVIVKQYNFVEFVEGEDEDE